ncbi:putative HVA22-like protein g [Hibiscus syriacus]|uniref:HVA22-like protein n=1 Tax=Hibiscus syriacus TaxID=106335 RepID=A0A6A3CHI9_HIBSY|nr:putative HVA22-like protein g [Hibiscus syriacus]KAE8726962.1 putative HVA22-like protein g [Hibiscus syriacus]
MLGDFLTRLLVLIFGYAYPAFECFKKVEKNRVEIDELRFWCKYWILVAFITVLERITDIFISWLPMYGEMKLGFFIYLWYPKTKGTVFVYDAIFRPFMAEHETEVDRKIMELRARAWDVFTHYSANCSEIGVAKFFEMFQYVVGQTTKFNPTKPNNPKSKDRSLNNIPPPPSPNGLRSPSAKAFNSVLSRVNFVDSPRYGQPDSPSAHQFDNGNDSIPYSTSNSRIQHARLNLRRTKPEN